MLYQHKLVIENRVELFKKGRKLISKHGKSLINKLPGLSKEKKNALIANLPGHMNFKQGKSQYGDLLSQANKTIKDHKSGLPAKQEELNKALESIEKIKKSKVAQKARQGGSSRDLNRVKAQIQPYNDVIEDYNKFNKTATDKVAGLNAELRARKAKFDIERLKERKIKAIDNAYSATMGAAAGAGAVASIKYGKNKVNSAIQKCNKKIYDILPNGDQLRKKCIEKELRNRK